MTSTDGEEHIPFWWMPRSSVPSSTPTKSVDKGTLSVGIFICINHELEHFDHSFSNKRNLFFFLMNGCAASLEDGHDSIAYSPAELPQHDRSFNVSALMSLLRVKTLCNQLCIWIGKEKIGVLLSVIIQTHENSHVRMIKSKLIIQFSAFLLGQTYQFRCWTPHTK